MFRIVSPWLLLLYCSTSIFCSVCQTLPRPVRFFALYPSCSGRPPLSLLLSRQIRSLAHACFSLYLYLRCFLLLPYRHCLCLLHIDFESKPLATAVHFVCQLLQLSIVLRNQINAIRESQVVDCLSSYSSTRLC